MFELWHQLILGGDIEAVFVVIKTEIVSLFDILAHIYKFGLAAGDAIAEMHPFADCYGFFISYVINVLGGFGVKKDFYESA